MLYVQNSHVGVSVAVFEIAFRNNVTTYIVNSAVICLCLDKKALAIFRSNILFQCVRIVYIKDKSFFL